MKTALIVIDVQRDFCEGGVLSALDTNTLIGPLNGLIEFCNSKNIPLFFTRDWHPVNHKSFKQYGGLWPVHCVQGSWGAGFPTNLLMPEGSVIIDKETLPDQVSYSDFRATGLQEKLKNLKIDEIAVCGIATEYCVKAGTIDGLKLGFGVIVLTDLIRPIDTNAGDAALKEMKDAGAILKESRNWMPG